MILHIIQARTASTRLHAKIWRKIKGKTLLEWHLINTESPYKRILAVPRHETRKLDMQRLCNKYGVTLAFPNCKENDLIKRYVLAAEKFKPEWIVRTTADCPFIDNKWFLDTIEMATSYDMPIFNTFKEGSCVEVFKYSFLKRADKEAKLAEHREHPTFYFRKGFRKESIDTLEEFNALKERMEK